MAIDIGTNTEIALAHDGPRHRDKLRLRPGVRGLPDPQRHEGGGRRHRARQITPDGEAASRRPSAGPSPSASAAPASSTCSPGSCHAGVVDKSGLMQATPARAQGRRASSTCVTEGPHGDIVFTQHDVRSLQLAKGAIQPAGSC